MSYTKIARRTTFEGAPMINCAAIFGASPKKPIIFRIPVTGKRPIYYSVEGLPNTLMLNDNVITGTVESEGEYKITIVCENELGKSEKKITLEIKEGGVLLTPLLGFTSWNAFSHHIKQEDIENVARRFVDLGLCEYGYSYINLDSGWQGEYGGEYDAIMPNFKFPDMKKMTDFVHSLGLKCGIYSTPMLTAWGCPDELKSIPGCTIGEPDYRFASTNGGIGIIHKEANNARQWEAWGFDYLKYDWAPSDPVNAELMRKELSKLSRDFGFCVTVNALKEYVEYWSKYCNSYRCNADTLSNYPNLLAVYDSYAPFSKYLNKGHFFDLDMLDFGQCGLWVMHNTLNEDEKIMQYSIRAFLSSPIQISSKLERPSDFELDIYSNEEIIAINQDCKFYRPVPILSVNNEKTRTDVYEKELENGKFAYMLLNLGESKISLSLRSEADYLRDSWAKENIAINGELNLEMMPHTVKIFTVDFKLNIKRQ